MVTGIQAVSFGSHVSPAGGGWPGQCWRESILKAACVGLCPRGPLGLECAFHLPSPSLANACFLLRLNTTYGDYTAFPDSPQDPTALSADLSTLDHLRTH